MCKLAPCVCICVKNASSEPEFRIFESKIVPRSLLAKKGYIQVYNLYTGARWSVVRKEKCINPIVLGFYFQFSTDYEKNIMNDAPMLSAHVSKSV